MIFKLHKCLILSYRSIIKRPFGISISGHFDHFKWLKCLEQTKPKIVLFYPLHLFSFNLFLFSISSIFIHPFNPFFVYFIYFYLSILFISIPFHPIYIFRMVKTISTIPNENGQNDQKQPSQTAPKNNKCHIFVHLFCFSVATNGLEICK